MRNYLRSSVAALGFGLMTAGALAPTVAHAQVVAPRQFNTQQVHYIRTTLSFNMCTLTGTAGAQSCTIKAQAALPYNSLILRIVTATSTAFNSATTDSITISTGVGGASIVGAACSVHAVGLVPCTLASSGAGGITSIGAGAPQLGLNGGNDIFILYSQTGAAPTAGLSAVIIEYIAPNDGACSATPMGTTAAGC